MDFKLPRSIGGRAPRAPLLLSGSGNKFLIKISNGSSGALRPRCSRSAANTFAFLAPKQTDTLELPLDFYQLLKVNPGVSRESVTRSYEK